MKKHKLSRSTAKFIVESESGQLMPDTQYQVVSSFTASTKDGDMTIEQGSMIKLSAVNDNSATIVVADGTEATIDATVLASHVQLMNDSNISAVNEAIDKAQIKSMPMSAFALDNMTIQQSKDKTYIELKAQKMWFVIDTATKTCLEAGSATDKPSSLEGFAIVESPDRTYQYMLQNALSSFVNEDNDSKLKDFLDWLDDDDAEKKSAELDKFVKDHGFTADDQWEFIWMKLSDDDRKKLLNIANLDESLWRWWDDKLEPLDRMIILKEVAPDYFNDNPQSYRLPFAQLIDPVRFKIDQYADQHGINVYEALSDDIAQESGVVSMLMQSIQTAHTMHINNAFDAKKVSVPAAHSALEEYYTDMPDLADRIAENMRFDRGIMIDETVKLSWSDPVVGLMSIRQALIGIRDRQSAATQSDIDSACSFITNIMYKLVFVAGFDKPSMVVNESEEPWLTKFKQLSPEDKTSNVKLAIMTDMLDYDSAEMLLKAPETWPEELKAAIKPLLESKAVNESLSDNARKFAMKFVSVTDANIINKVDAIIDKELGDVDLALDVAYDKCSAAAKKQMSELVGATFVAESLQRKKASLRIAAKYINENFEDNKTYKLVNSLTTIDGVGIPAGTVITYTGNDSNVDAAYITVGEDSYSVSFAELMQATQTN